MSCAGSSVSRRATPPSAGATGKARFTVNPLDVLTVPPGHLLLQTVRSHDQFNTTIYGLDDRYRGITTNRRVVMMHADDIAAAGLAAGGRVDLESCYGGETRTVKGFEVVAYDVPRGCAATYYPEANPLVPIDSVADGSNTPTYKSVRIRVRRAGEGAG